jgi:hypothetical protein
MQLVLVNDGKKGVPMKRWVLVTAIVVSFLAVFLDGLPWASDRTYGQLRALKRRAATVMQQKNNFVARVLHFQKVAYQVNDEGVVTRLQIGSRWVDVNRIEIVPLVGEQESGLEVVGHEIFFYAEGEIFHLVSYLTIR